MAGAAWRPPEGIEIFPGPVDEGERKPIGIPRPPTIEDIKEEEYYETMREAIKNWVKEEPASWYPDVKNRPRYAIAKDVEYDGRIITLPKKRADMPVKAGLQMFNGKEHYTETFDAVIYDGTMLEMRHPHYTAFVPGQAIFRVDVEMDRMCEANCLQLATGVAPDKTGYGCSDVSVAPVLLASNSASTSLLEIGSCESVIAKIDPFLLGDAIERDSVARGGKRGLRSVYEGPKLSVGIDACKGSVKDVKENLATGLARAMASGYFLRDTDLDSFKGLPTRRDFKTAAKAVSETLDRVFSDEEKLASIGAYPGGIDRLKYFCAANDGTLEAFNKSIFDALADEMKRPMFKVAGAGVKEITDALSFQVSMDDYGELAVAVKYDVESDARLLQKSHAVAAQWSGYDAMEVYSDKVRENAAVIMSYGNPDAPPSAREEYLEEIRPLGSGYDGPNY